jgi:hypothetical protein
LRPLRGRHAYKASLSRPCQTPCSHAWKSGCLYTSFDQDHDSVLLLFFEHQTSHAACFNAQGLLTSASLTPLIFLVVSTCRETCFPSRHYSTYFFFFIFGSSYRPSCLPRCSDTTP